MEHFDFGSADGMSAASQESDEDDDPPPAKRKSPKRRSQNQIHLARQIRASVKSLLKLDDDKETLIKRCVEQWEIKDWIDAKCSGPTVDNFRLDLENKGTLTRWNKAACTVFVSYFKSSPAHQKYSTVIVTKAFETHLIQLKRNMAKARESVKTKTKGGQSVKSDRERQNRRVARRKRVCLLFYFF